MRRRWQLLKQNRSGETIVEVMVSMLLFLLLLALLQGAVRFAGAAIVKSRQLREDNAAVASLLRTGAAENNGNAKIYFYAIRADGSEVAQSPSFGMDVLLNQRVLEYREGKTRTYALYGSARQTSDPAGTEQNSENPDSDADPAVRKDLPAQEDQP